MKKMIWMDKPTTRMEKAIKLAEINGFEKVLDLGCGRCKIRGLCGCDDYTGVDCSDTWDQDLSRNPGETTEDFIDWNLERGLPPKIRKQRFDVIFMLEFIEHIENFRTLLKQCKDVLTENGRIIISTPSSERFIIDEAPSHIHCFRKTNMRNLARICGLEVTEIIGTYITIPVLHIAVPPLPFYSDLWIYRMEGCQPVKTRKRRR